MRVFLFLFAYSYLKIARMITIVFWIFFSYIIFHLVLSILVFEYRSLSHLLFSIPIKFIQLFSHSYIQVYVILALGLIENYLDVWSSLPFSETKKFFRDVNCQCYQLFAPMLVEIAKQLFFRWLIQRKICLFVKW